MELSDYPTDVTSYDPRVVNYTRRLSYYRFATAESLISAGCREDMIYALDLCDFCGPTPYYVEQSPFTVDQYGYIYQKFSLPDNAIHSSIKCLR